MDKEDIKAIWPGDRHRSAIPIDKLLVANRGEIAHRIIRTAKKMGIPTVAIYVEQEKDAAYVSLADEAISLGDGELTATFLNIQKILSIAICTQATAIHPGYGFLSENPDFAQACTDHQLLFVGPGADILRLTANKQESKKVAASLGIPVLKELELTLDQPIKIDPKEFPLLIKATFGGGGKAMQLVNREGELQPHLQISARKALSYFGNGTLFAERYLPNARHVEVQLLGDHHDNLIHLYERECSIQRNHQKIIEEAPALFLSSTLRQQILEAALLLGKYLKYVGAGTVEFLVDEAGQFYFMEMNPRIQVEHAVTEEITGIDLVAAQLAIAAGAPLPWAQEEVTLHGHAIQARIYAEQPAAGFTPSVETLYHLHVPEEKNLRFEADLRMGRPAVSQFDPMLLKLIAWGKERNEARLLLASSLQSLNILGPENNGAYLEAILTHPLYRNDHISVEFCQQHHDELCRNEISLPEPDLVHALLGLMIARNYPAKGHHLSADPWQYLGHWRNTLKKMTFRVNEANFELLLNFSDLNRNGYSYQDKNYQFELAEDNGTLATMVTSKGKFLLSYHERGRGELIAGWRNKTYRISIPELLNSGRKQQPTTSQATTGEVAIITSPLHGRVVEIMVKEKQRIRKGESLLVIEAMKSENKILAQKEATIKHIAVNVGAQVTDRMPLIFLEE